MQCNKCGAKLPNGLKANYCLVCQERMEVLRSWIDKILEEKQTRLEV